MGYGAPGAAVDGKSNVLYHHRSCSHTDLQEGPWWMVDLEFSALVGQVSVVSRSCSGLCGEYLKAFRIMIGTVNSNLTINKYLIFEIKV